MSAQVETRARAGRPTGPPRRYRFDSQFIAGAWRRGRSGRTLRDVDPYTGETLDELALADIGDVDAAYEAAAKAQSSWEHALPGERAELTLRCAAVIDERRDEIIEWLIRESGSTRTKAEGEWQWVKGVTLEAASFAHRAAGRILPNDVPGKESRVYRQALGVIGVISPWNFPLYLAQRAVAPALAVGNAVVLKPAQDTPISGGLLLARLYEEAGLRPGLLNVVVGASSEIGDAFVQHAVPAMIAFTGSTEVGRHVASLAATAPVLKRVTLELGGNSPLVVLADADIGQAVRAAIYARYFHQGQICMSANRIIVDTNVYDEFVERFAERAAALKFGDPGEPDTVVGPVINARQLERMLRFMASARAAGARQVLGAEPRNLVLPPHVFSGVTNGMAIAKNETFGPIAAIVGAYGDQHALEIANDTEYGLSSAVFTGSEERGLRFALALRAGMTHVNDGTVNDSPNSPFGGEKNSGVGRYGGEWIMRELTRDHWITVQHAPRQYPF
ncbi:MAG: yfmT 1 [Betaproteobacteria bacterium]|nr:yfmT 1 [Betaproteobacteria bacterium]